MSIYKLYIEFYKFDNKRINTQEEYQSLLSSGNWPSMDSRRPDWALRINEQ